MVPPASSEVPAAGGAAGAPEIGPQDALASQKEGAVLLDVREDHEVAAGHAPGIVHVRMRELPERLDELPKDARILVICRTGNRSGRATQFLNAQGYDALNVAGGMRAWAAAGQAVQGAGGGAGRVV